MSQIKRNCKTENCNSFVILDPDDVIPGNFIAANLRFQDFAKKVGDPVFLHLKDKSSKEIKTVKALICDFEPDTDKFSLINIEDVVKDEKLQLDRKNKILELTKEFLIQNYEEIVIYGKCEKEHWNRYIINK